MVYFKDGAFADDPFAAVAVTSGADWLAQRDRGGPSPVALRLDPSFPVETFTGDLAGIALVKVAFPKFTDGRGYSIGWLLRTRLRYTGEMRAVGDVLFDEMQLMMRCGFDAFEIEDEPTLRLLGEGRRAATIKRFYQPGLEREVPVGTRPWARRSA